MEDLRTEPRWPTQRAAPTRCSSAARSACAHGATDEGLFASAVVPEGIPPRAALARRTLWLVKSSSLAVLFLERPVDRQWGRACGLRIARRYLALYHLKPTFVVASRPPVASAFCQAAADLFATVDSYRMVPHIFRDGLCDDEY